MTAQPPGPSWRKPAGALMIVAMIAIWAWAVSMAMERVELPVAFSLLVYAVAGIVWIFPARSILVWMETGRWRA